MLASGPDLAKAIQPWYLCSTFIFEDVEAQSNPASRPILKIFMARWPVEVGTLGILL